MNTNAPSAIEAEAAVSIASNVMRLEESSDTSTGSEHTLLMYAPPLHVDNGVNGNTLDTKIIVVEGGTNAFPVTTSKPLISCCPVNVSAV